MFVLESVAAGESASYRNFSFPYHRRLLDAPTADVVAVGASLMGKPAGLALAQIGVGEPKSAQLHSVVVAAAHRKSGMGGALLASVESEARSRGCEYLHGVFMTGGDSGAATEALLRKNGWSEPQSRRLICECGLEHAPAWFASLVASAVDLPAEYSVFPWVELSAEERSAVAAREGTPGWHSPALSPFPDEPLEPTMSLGLRHKGEVAGWAIWTVFEESRVRCARLFVRRDLQRLGRGIALLAQSIERARGRAQGRLGPPINRKLTGVRPRQAPLCGRVPQKPKWTRAIFDVAVENEPMVKFVRRRMAPYLTSLRETRGSWKRL
jgi:GNAT superfamily N-acetyltransferase